LRKGFRRFGLIGLADVFVFWFGIKIKTFPRYIKRDHGDRRSKTEGGLGSVKLEVDDE
jgi:hypothetical protein